jgi:hypothetical protein
MAVFRGVVPCSSSTNDRLALLNEAVTISETSVSFCEITRRRIHTDRQTRLRIHKKFHSNIMKFILPVIL